MNQSLTLAFLVAAGIGLVVQNTLMVRITQSSSTILIAMLLNSLVGIVLFVSILLLKQGVSGFSELAATVRWWTLIPGLPKSLNWVVKHRLKLKNNRKMRLLNKSSPLLTSSSIAVP